MMGTKHDGEALSALPPIAHNELETADGISPGLRKAHLLSSQLRVWDRALLFLSIFCVAFAYSLDGCMRLVAFQAQATSIFEEHALIGCINVVIFVTAAAAQPVIAKSADVFGRLEVVAVSAVLYPLGTIIQATSRHTAVYCVGAVIYNLGYIAIIVTAEIIIADTTSLRSRVLFSYIPTLPFLINVWLSGDVAEATLNNIGWRWGVGMMGIIYTGCVIPLIFVLWLYSRRGKKNTESDQSRHQNNLKITDLSRLMLSSLWKLDIIGMGLIVFALGLTLTPLTLGKTKSYEWVDPCILVPIVLGLICIPLFFYWETVAEHPMLPRLLLKNRSVWGALGIAFTFNMAFHLQSAYLFAVLQLGLNRRTKPATRIANYYSFASVITGAIVGLVVYKVRHLKPFIMLGTAFYFVAFVLQAEGIASRSHHGMAGTQFLLGIGGGLFPYLTMASIQADSKREHLAVVTGLYLATYRVGAAFGACMAAILWNFIGRSRIYSDLPEDVADWAFHMPIVFASQDFCDQPFCSFSVREGLIVAEAYIYIQQRLCMVAAGLCVPLFVLTFIIANPRLGDGQSLAQEEALEIHELQNYDASVNAKATPAPPATAQSNTVETPRTPRQADTAFNFFDEAAISPRLPSHK